MLSNHPLPISLNSLSCKFRFSSSVLAPTTCIRHIVGFFDLCHCIWSSEASMTGFYPWFTAVVAEKFRDSWVNFLKSPLQWVFWAPALAPLSLGLKHSLRLVKTGDQYQSVRPEFRRSSYCVCVPVICKYCHIKHIIWLAGQQKNDIFIFLKDRCTRPTVPWNFRGKPRRRFHHHLKIGRNKWGSVSGHLLVFLSTKESTAL